MSLARYKYFKNRIELHIPRLISTDLEAETQCNQTLLHELGHVVNFYYLRFVKIRPIWAHRLISLGRLLSIITVLLMGTTVLTMDFIQYGHIHGLILTITAEVLALFITMALIANLMNRLKYKSIKKFENKHEQAAEEFVERFKKRYSQLIWVDAKT